MDLRYLSEMRHSSIDDDQKKRTLIRIPETIAEHVAQKYDEENSSDDMGQFVFDYLERLENRNTDQCKKAVGAVSGESEKLGKEEHGHEWTYQYHWICEYGKLRTASPAPEKRRAQEGTSEDHEVRDGLSDPTEAKGKAKRTGSKGGCHECGGDHYARDCAVRPSKSKKAKEKARQVGIGYRRNIGRRLTQDSGRRNGNDSKPFFFGTDEIDKINVVKVQAQKT